MKQAPESFATADTVLQGGKRQTFLEMHPVRMITELWLASHTARTSAVPK